MLNILKFSLISLFSKTAVASQNMSTVVETNVRYLTQQEAIDIDQELFNEYKFSVDQLMELAGLSVACTIAACYGKGAGVLIFCGPGNNGGDGLVAARHLKQFGYLPAIYYPVRKKNQLYENLFHQCVATGVKIHDTFPTTEQVEDNDVILDAVFGFSFKPPVREAFVPIIELFNKTDTPICSVDIPSGWDVEAGPPSDNSFQPELLISLTAPKLCANFFTGRYHFIGGRFLPRSLQTKYDLKLPEYQGTETYVRIK